MASQAVAMTAASKLDQSRYRSYLRDQQQQQQQHDASRLQNVQVIDLPNGMKKYRLTGLRTGKENSIDIIDRTIPFVHKLKFVQVTNIFEKVIYWCFTCSFWKFAFASIVTFFVLCIAFAFLVLASVYNSPDCLSPSVAQVRFPEQFMDALHLSWTTFTTVGYGIIAPATGGHGEFMTDPKLFRKDMMCLPVNFVLSFESLMGVLFVGFCSAILFGKLMSFQSNAKVAFSNIMAVSFGEKVYLEDEDDDEEYIAAAAAAASAADVVSNHKSLRDIKSKVYKISCPILRFRIANELHSNNSGEITDAGLNVFATIDAKNSILAVKSERVFGNAMQIVGSENDISVHGISGARLSALRAIKKGAHATSHGIKSLSQGVKSRVRYSSSVAQPSRLRVNYSLGYFHPTSDLCIQEETDMVQPNLVFANVQVEPSRHPFFRATWVVSHVLNESSPLLTRYARKRISDNGGYWPEDMNSVEGIRSAVHFDQFLVSFSGNSKIAGGSVYRQKIYTLDSLKIGYTFKSLLMKNADDSIFVRVNDIDRVQKQTWDRKKDTDLFYFLK